MRKYIGEKATSVLAAVIVFFTKLYMKIRHPVAWREYMHEKYMRMREAEERKAAKKRMRFVTNCTYGNDVYDDYLKNIQLLRHFSAGGMIIMSNNGIYCVLDEDFLQRKEEIDNVS